MNDIRSLNSLEDIAFAVSRIDELESENAKLKAKLLRTNKELEDVQNRISELEVHVAIAIGDIENLKGKK
ncbi:hypothetical protein N9Z41_02755 [bacterium]|nr:hypothetical protein [bacterium]